VRSSRHVGVSYERIPARRDPRRRAREPDVESGADKRFAFLAVGQEALAVGEGQEGGRTTPAVHRTPSTVVPCKRLSPNVRADLVPRDTGGNTVRRESFPHSGPVVCFGCRQVLGPANGGEPLTQGSRHSGALLGAAGARCCRSGGNGAQLVVLGVAAPSPVLVPRPPSLKDAVEMRPQPSRNDRGPGGQLCLGGPLPSLRAAAPGSGLAPVPLAPGLRSHPARSCARLAGSVSSGPNGCT